MEEVVGFVGFSLGVALAGGIVRSFSGGLRPVVKSVVKAGLVTTEAVSTAAAKTGSSLSSMAAEAREGANGPAADAASGDAASADTAPRQIMIARE